MRYRSSSENITPILVIVVINLLVLIISFFDRNLIVSLLGISKSTFFAQPWTILTSMFTHVEMWHLLFNMISLYFLGRFFLGLVGTKGFLITYIGGGILGGILFLLLASPFNVGIGASGAIFALGGALAIIAPKVRVYLFLIPVPIPLWIAILIFLVLSFLPRIAWQAHLGGLIFGLIAGLYYRKRIRAFFY